VTNWRDLPPISEEAQPDFAPDWTPSQTFLRRMDACDRAALLLLQYGGGAATHELNRGSIVHEVAERLERMLLAAHRERAEGIGTDPAPDYEIEDAREHAEHLVDQLGNTIPPDLGRQVLYEVMAERPELQVSAEERDACRYMVDHFCRGTTFEPDKIIGIEKTLTLETGGFRVLIRPDLIEEPEPRVCRIRDYKTAWPPDSEEFRAQAYDSHGNPRWAGNYQLNMAAVVAAFGITDDGLPLGNFERFILDLEFPRILRDDGIDRRRVEVDRLQVQSFRDDLDLQLKRLREVCIGKRKWTATEGNHCRECPCEAKCPLPRVLRPESQNANLDSIADLEKAATTWNFMSGSAQRLKGRLKKAAETFPDEDLRIGTDENGDPILGVRIGTDLALVFTPTQTEKIIDRDNLFASAEAAARFGEPFNRDDHVKRSEGVSFAKRKIEPGGTNGP
jgi:hypothetical protein